MSKYVTVEEYRFALETIKRAIKNNQLFTDHQATDFVFQLMVASPGGKFDVDCAAIIGHETMEKRRATELLREIENKRMTIKMYEQSVAELTNELHSMESR